MVGSPLQTPENLADDMLFLKRLDPHMVGIDLHSAPGDALPENRRYAL